MRLRGRFARQPSAAVTSPTPMLVPRNTAVDSLLAAHLEQLREVGSGKRLAHLLRSSSDLYLAYATQLAEGADARALEDGGPAPASLWQLARLRVDTFLDEMDGKDLFRTAAAFLISNQLDPLLSKKISLRLNEGRIRDLSLQDLGELCELIASAESCAEPAPASAGGAIPLLASLGMAFCLRGVQAKPGDLVRVARGFSSAKVADQVVFARLAAIAMPQLPFFTTAQLLDFLVCFAQLRCRQEGLLLAAANNSRLFSNSVTKEFSVAQVMDVAFVYSCFGMVVPGLERVLASRYADVVKSFPLRPGGGVSCGGAGGDSTNKNYRSRTRADDPGEWDVVDQHGTSSNNSKEADKSSPIPDMHLLYEDKADEERRDNLLPTSGRQGHRSLEAFLVSCDELNLSFVPHFVELAARRLRLVDNYSGHVCVRPELFWRVLTVTTAHTTPEHSTVSHDVQALLVLCDQYLEGQVFHAQQMDSRKIFFATRFAPALANVIGALARRSHHDLSTFLGILEAQLRGGGPMHLTELCQLLRGVRQLPPSRAEALLPLLLPHTLRAEKELAELLKGWSAEEEVDARTRLTTQELLPESVYWESLALSVRVLGLDSGSSRGALAAVARMSSNERLRKLYAINVERVRDHEVVDDPEVVDSLSESERHGRTISTEAAVSVPCRPERLKKLALPPHLLELLEDGEFGLSAALLPFYVVVLGSGPRAPAGAPVSRSTEQTESRDGAPAPETDGADPFLLLSPEDYVRGEESFEVRAPETDGADPFLFTGPAVPAE